MRWYKKPRRRPVPRRLKPWRRIPDDIPFAVLYLIDRKSKQLLLEQTCAISDEKCTLVPQSLDLAGENDDRCLWPLAGVANTGHSQVVSVKEIEGLPLGVGQQRLTEAIVLPVTSRGEAGTVGVLVAGSQFRAANSMRNIAHFMN